MKLKATSAFALAAAAGLLLAGCSGDSNPTPPTPEPTVSESPEPSLTALDHSDFISIISSADALEAAATELELDTAYHWNEGETDFSNAGDYSMTFVTTEEEDRQEICYTIADKAGAIKLISATGKFTFSYEVDLTGDCATFDSNFAVDVEMIPPGERWDLEASSSDDDAAEYVTELQNYYDEMKASAPASE